MIYIFTGSILFALICLMVICVNILDRNKALKIHVEILNKDHNSISKENLELKEMLEIQDKMIEESMKAPVDRLD